jgi:hypothetical protein
MSGDGTSFDGDPCYAYYHIGQIADDPHRTEVYVRLNRKVPVNISLYPPSNPAQ